MGCQTLLLTFLLLFHGVCADAEPLAAARLKEQNEVLFHQLQNAHTLTNQQMAIVRDIFAKSGCIGQGNPTVTRHSATPGECEEKLKNLGVNYENPTFTKICGAKYMAPLYNPTVEKPEDTTVCIDQFEFPNIP